MDDYKIVVNTFRNRAGRMQTGGWQPEITHPDGTTKLGPRIYSHVKDGEQQANDWAVAYIDAHRNGRIQPSSTPKPADPAPMTQPTRDRRADQVAGMLGVSPAAVATGRCHYCGLPLNRQGYCEECS